MHSEELQGLLGRLAPAQAKDLEQMALEETVVSIGFSAIDTGMMTIEQALVTMVMVLASEKKELQEQLVKAKNEKAPALIGDAAKSRAAIKDMARRYDR